VIEKWVIGFSEYNSKMDGCLVSVSVIEKWMIGFSECNSKMDE
jgi:hypothetical protein